MEEYKHLENGMLNTTTTIKGHKNCVLVGKQNKNESQVKRGIFQDNK